MRTRLALLLAASLPAFAQEQDVQRALIERDQRTAEFAARVHNAPLAEQHRLGNIAARQLIEVRPELPPELRPYERQKAAREIDSFLLRLPPPVARIEIPKALRPRLGPIPPASD